MYKKLRCITNLKILTEKDSIFWFGLRGWQLTEDQALKMVYTRRKARADANPKFTPIIQYDINIREVPTPSRTVFTPGQNESFVQKVVQNAQGLEGEVLYYHILGLNESETYDDLEKADRKLALRSHPDRNNHPQDSAAFFMTQQAKKGLEDVLRYNDTMRRTQEIEEDIQRQ